MDHLTSAEHYLEAEKLLSKAGVGTAEQAGDFFAADTQSLGAIAAAHVHALLALADPQPRRRPFP